MYRPRGTGHKSNGKLGTSVYRYGPERNRPLKIGFNVVIHQHEAEFQAAGGSGVRWKWKFSVGPKSDTPSTISAYAAVEEWKGKSDSSHFFGVFQKDCRSTVAVRTLSFANLTLALNLVWWWWA